MKTNSIARAAARVVVVGATAVALTLGSASLAGASDSSTGSASFSTTSGSADSARKAPFLRSFTAAANPIRGNTTGVYLRFNQAQGVPGNRVLATVRKGSRTGAILGRVDITDGSFAYPRKWGRGARYITGIGFYNNSQFVRGDNATAGFFLRSAVKGSIKIRSTGTRKSVRAVGKIYSTDKGKYVTAKRVKFQVLSGGKWKTKKTIKLNKKGVGRYSFRASSKKKYRVVIKTTSTVSGAKTRGIRI